jgi:hypothetical protein
MALSQHLSGSSKENKKNTVSGQVVSWERFEKRDPRIINGSANLADIFGILGYFLCKSIRRQSRLRHVLF